MTRSSTTGLRPTRSIAIVGAGPRGTGILERIVARGELLDDPIDVHVVDPYPTGAGRIWRREQDTLLWMNSVAADVAMLPDADGGPTLAQWVLANRDSLLADPALRDEVSRFTSTAFASRSLQSRYLTWIFESVIKSSPDRVRVHIHRATVTDITDHAVGQQLSLDDGTTIDVGTVVLAQGHPDSLPSPRESKLAQLAAEHGLIYVGPGYTADLDPTVVPEAEPILVSGLGLAFVDSMVLLAESRGGTFARSADGTLEYTASGREPLVYAGSRRGVPYHAKLSYPIVIPPLPRFFTPDALPDGVVDFREDVWPLAAKEVAGAHYHELFHSHPERTRGSWTDFDAVFATEDWSSPRVRDLEVEFVPDPLDRIDLAAIDRPLAGETYTSLDEARDRVHEYIDADLRRRRDPEFSSDAAVFSGLLSVYVTVGELVRTERLTSTDVAVEVEGWLHSFFSFLASGPPPERLEQLLALGRAGVIQYLGPDVSFAADADGFVATSAAHPDVIRARTYIEARLPVPSISRSGDTLLRTLHRRGEVQEIRASETSPAKLAVDGHSRLLDAAGKVHARRYAVGPWVAGHTWSAAFARPGINAGFFRHNDAIAEELLA